MQTVLPLEKEAEAVRTFPAARLSGRGPPRRKAMTASKRSSPRAACGRRGLARIGRVAGRSCALPESSSSPWPCAPASTNISMAGDARCEVFRRSL